jgi:hypothetical protein
MGNIIADKFKEDSIVEQSQGQKAAYIALRQLNSSNCLSEFAKQTTNLSDLLRFNSTTFFRYFTNIKSFDSSNTILLSTMYLTELTPPWGLQSSDSRAGRKSGKRRSVRRKGCRYRRL